MKNKAKAPDESVHQTVTDPIKLKCGLRTTEIEFTDRPISGQAGLAPLAAFFHRISFINKLAQAIPFTTTSPNATSLRDVALGYILGALSGCRSLNQMGYLKRDKVLSVLFGASRLVSSSTYSRFFQRFSHKDNQSCFPKLFSHCLFELPSLKTGYTLDLDSTHLEHDDNYSAQGLETGYTSVGFKRNYHPMLGVIGGMVAGFWLRRGDTRCDNNVCHFVQGLLNGIPHHVNLSLLRADSGFLNTELLGLLESKKLPFIIVARVHKALNRKIQAINTWSDTPLNGTQTAEVIHQETTWNSPRRLVVLRHDTTVRKDAGGKELFDQKTYRYQALYTNLPSSKDGFVVWQIYNKRADIENVIKELEYDFGLSQICLQDFFGTEAAMSFKAIAFNLMVLLRRFFHWPDMQAETLRRRLFQTGGVLSRSARQFHLRLSVVGNTGRLWWRTVFEKLSSDLRNCNAVGNSFG